jgi:GcrA cell cycle regulator
MIKGETWTDQNTKTLIDMVTSGATSKEVALALGISRNSVIGRARRLRVKFERSQGKVARPYIRKKQRPPYEGAEAVRIRIPRRRGPDRYVSAAPPTAPEPTPPEPAEQGATRCSLMELSATSCRWPIGDPRHPDFHFCGATRIEGLPYCGEHSRRAWVR